MTKRDDIDPMALVTDAQGVPTPSPEPQGHGDERSPEETSPVDASGQDLKQLLVIDSDDYVAMLIVATACT